LIKNLVAGVYFSTDSKPLEAQIKRRYKDFIVEEITKEKEICEVNYFLEEGKEKQKLVIPERPAGKNYIHFNLEKINMDVALTLRNLARKTFVSRKRFGYAGIKDKRAISCQKMSFFVKDEIDIERLANAVPNRMNLSNAVWAKDTLDLGALFGNRFTITLRDIEQEEKEIKEIIEDCFKQMNDKGVPNYFGMQRFGGTRKVSHLIGKELILGNIENAVMLFLTYTGDFEREEFKRVRTELEETRDFPKAVKEFPAELFLEKAVLDFLVKRPNDFENAFRTIPKNLRYFFTHAYQSYLFNKIIDKRIEDGIGLGLQEGEREENGVPLGLLPGYESRFSEGIIGKIEKKVMKEEEIELEQFKMDLLPECSSRGSLKTIVLKPFDFKLIEISKDEEYENKLKAIIKFSLTKGNYATTVLREVLKQQEVM